MYTNQVGMVLLSAEHSAFYIVVMILGALGLFLFGMTLMSDALQKMAGDKMRNVLSVFTANPFKAILTGAFVTSIIQSSSATTVMVVSFVNAGLLKLRNAIGVIMGANIGTTFTAWLITLLGFKVDMSLLALPLIALSMILIMFKKPIGLKQAGDFLLGFSILFLGLGLMKENVPAPEELQGYAFIQSIAQLSDPTYASILVAVLIGTVCTVVLQSSSAMMALTLTFCNQGLVPFEIACALVLGENIGTTITANLAALVGNTQARRAAFSHFLFNLIGVIWILCLFRFVIQGIDFLTVKIEGHSPLVTATAIPLALSLFHTIFNVINTMLLVWFIPQLEKLTTLVIKTKPNQDDEIFKLTYIDPGLMNISEFSLDSASQEIVVMAERGRRMLFMLPELLDEKKTDNYKKIFNRIVKYEDISDEMEKEIAAFLSKVSENSISQSGGQKLRSMFRIIDNLESVSDQLYQMALMINNKNESHSYFTPEMREKIKVLFNLVAEAYDDMLENLKGDYGKVDIENSYRIEEKINACRDEMRTQHLDDLKENKYSYQTGIFYSALYALLEKVGDHIINIAEAMANSKVKKPETTPEYLVTGE